MFLGALKRAVSRPKKDVYSLNKVCSLSLAFASFFVTHGVKGGRERSGSVCSGEDDGLITFGGYGIIMTGSVCVAVSLTVRVEGPLVVLVDVSPCLAGVVVLGSF